MKAQWHAFLQDAGAEFETETTPLVMHFGNPEREIRSAQTGLVLCDLSHYGLIEVHGKDAADFLQNQLTNDIRNISAEHAQYNAYCNPKGRMLAMMKIFRLGDTFFLRLPGTLVDSIMKRMHMFVLRSEVTLHDADNDLMRFGLSGPKADTELNDAVGAHPQKPGDVWHKDGMTIIRLSGIHPRFEIYAELEPAKKLWDRLNVRAAPVGAQAWTLLDILAGVPEVYPQTQEEFVPQMVNLQLIDGVSFQKGCYPGQEIVARMHYLGKLKRRMYILHVNSDEQPAPGSEIFTDESVSAEPIGTIVSSAPFPAGGFHALAVLTIRVVDELAPLYLGGHNGVAAEIHNPPYAFEQTG